MLESTTRGELCLSPGGVPIGPTSPRALARVPFHEGELLAVAGPVDQEGDRPVPLRPFCDRLGLDHSAQLAKLRSKPWATVGIIATVAEDGKIREMAALPLRALPMWLATINPGKVRPEARGALVAFQLEAADCLYRHFLGAPAPAGGALAAEVAELRQRVDAQGAELRQLIERPRTAQATRLGRWAPLTPEAAAKVRAYCEDRPVVHGTALLREALGLSTWGSTETTALGAELRALGYERRKTSLPPPLAPRRAWRWRRAPSSSITQVAGGAR